MKAIVSAKKQTLPLFIVGLAFAIGNSAIAGPQSMLDPYFGVQPLKSDADGKKPKTKTKTKAAKVIPTSDLTSAKSDLDSYPDSYPAESKIKATGSLAHESVAKNQSELVREAVVKQPKGLAKEPVAKQPKTLAKEPANKKAINSQLAAETANPVGVIAGTREMAHGLAVTTKGVGTDVYHGAKLVGYGIATSAKYVGHGLHKASNGTVAASGKIKNGTLAMGGKIKDGASDVAPKAKELPKVVATGVKTGYSKIKAGTVATGHVIAHATTVTKDKIAGMFGGGGTKNVATASRPTDNSKDQ